MSMDILGLIRSCSGGWKGMSVSVLGLTSRIEESEGKANAGTDLAGWRSDWPLK